MASGDPQPPLRPTDPFFSVLWDLTYGPASPTNPLNKLGQQIDGLKDSMRTISHVVSGLDEINRNTKEATGVIREANAHMKEASAILKSLAEKL
ncbi:MAG: hypothetical protein Q8M94_16680 [Ignavibacteria bacterium]|nr:hypothetical protein [Ignavibacteria bacterium]